MRSLVDGFLELTVVGSFSRSGILIRRKLFDWTSLSDGSLAGTTILVTGPTSGLGRVTAVALARLGARVVLVGRSAERLGQVRDELVAAHGADRFPIAVADMGSLVSVRAAVAEILARETRLDVIVDNAGAIFLERTMSPDGIEATFATCVVGPFALIDGLLPLMERSGGGRIIAVTSGGMYAQALDLDDLGSQRVAYTGALAYARAKRAQTALVRERARRLALRGSSVTINAMHPGWADTPGLADTLPTFHRLMGPFLRSPEEGADTIIWLAADPAAGGLSGGLFLDRRPRPFDRVPTTRVTAADRRRLWDAVAGMAGIEPGPAPD
ncbi:MAG: SDR family NAD(P)-dependent oxidoreductase [Candidatus Limnocylindrales bacterium]